MLTLTKTMLGKSIIDANKNVRGWALEKLAVDYTKMKPGQKLTFPAMWPDGSKTEIRFYLTAGKRADRRVSIEGIKQQCVEGDTLTFSIARPTSAGVVVKIAVQS